MPSTPKMHWPYPPYARKPYYTSPPGFGIVDFFNAVDAAVYALLGGASAPREDRNVLFSEGGVFTFDAGTGTLSWDDTLWIVSGNIDDAVCVPAGSVVIPDGQYAFVTVPRPIAGGGTVTMNVGAGGVGSTDTNFMICYRDGNGVYFRNGFVLLGGQSSRPFYPSDNYIWGNPILNAIPDPPGSPTIGDRYLVVGPASGAWFGHEGQITEWSGNLWIFTPPKPGMIGYVPLMNMFGIYPSDAVGWTILNSWIQEYDSGWVNDQEGMGKIRRDAIVDANGFGILAAMYIKSNGHYEPAKADSASTMPCCGIVLETGTGTKRMLRSGLVRNDSWTFANIGQPVYLDPSTAGGVTQTEPSVGGQKIQILGHAEDTHILDFNPNLAVAEV